MKIAGASVTALWLDARVRGCNELGAQRWSTKRASKVTMWARRSRAEVAGVPVLGGEQQAFDGTKRRVERRKYEAERTG